MAVINTGIVLRTITGVNESDLFLGSESTSVATNTGIVERSVVGVHDANFVHPLGDEDVLNGDFSNGSTGWILGEGWSIGEDKVVVTSTINQQLKQNLTTTIGKSYKVSLEILDITEGAIRIYLRDGGTAYFVGGTYTSSGVYDFYFTSTETLNTFAIYPYGTTTASITNISVKEVLVNRESTVNNTGIVERPITGVNESDPMFPDNTISNIVNIAGLVSSLIEDLKARATTFENEEATRNILINLQNC